MTPAESDFLLRLAALSLSFVGFSAVVVTLRGALGGELSASHLRLVRLYIEGGLLVTVLGLVPTLLNLLQVPESVTWRVQRSRCFDLSFVLLIQFRRRRAVGADFRHGSSFFGDLPILVLGLWLNGRDFLSAGIGPYRPLP